MKTRLVLLSLLLTAFAAPAAPPDFQEIYGLIRSNLAGATPEQLDAAALNGLSNEFHGRVSIVDAATPGSANLSEKPLAKSALYEGMFAYFRIGAVSDDLPVQLRQAWASLAESNKARIKGVVLDLRFADGSDFAAAGKTADCFLPISETLLEWPGNSISSVKKDDAITAPVAILINNRTAGAAEALAAVLRATDRALTVGSSTAGQASVYKEFPLSNGQKLRIAVAEVKLAGGPSLSSGLTADIPVQSTLEEDTNYLRNPYHELAAGTNTAGENTNQPVRRFNEAELVREQRRGLNPGEELDATPTSATSGPEVVTDPTLARALDLLKGLNVLSASKPG